MKHHFLRYAAVFVATLLFAASCSNEPNEPNNPSAPEQPVTEWNVPEYTVTTEHSYNRAQLIDRALSSYNLEGASTTISTIKQMLGYTVTDKYTYRELKIDYQSIDHRGNPITLSGILCYKTTKGALPEINRIIIDNHATIADNASCPSEAGSVGQLLMLRNEAAIISADYQGYGTSRSAIHPYLNEPLTARQQIDLLKAAIDHLYKSSEVAISKNLKTTAIGYSQGGAVALAVHHMLETEEQRLAAAIGFNGSYCGDGPYSLERTLEAYIRQGEVSIPAILPMLVRSMMECYPETFGDLTLADFFTPEFLNAGGDIMHHIDAKELNVIAYNVMLGADNPLTARFPITAILTAEALQPGSPQMAAMTAAFARNNCILDWTPTNYVTFFHSPDDTVVPYDNLADTASWPADRYTVTHPTTSGVDHLAGALHFYSPLLLMPLK